MSGALDDVEVTEAQLLALTPWAVVGASVYALFQLGVLATGYGDAVSVPVAYLGTALLAAGAWLVAGPLAGRIDQPAPLVLAALGTLAAAVAVGYLLSTAGGGLALAWPLAGVAVSLALAAGVWLLLDRTVPEATAATGYLGMLAVFGHALDGVLTAIGIDVLGFGERTPLSRAIIDFTAGLPTADLLGTVWLFVAIKLALATLIVWLLAETVRESPSYGRILLAVVAAVGLGPGLHNTLLFVVA